MKKQSQEWKVNDMAEGTQAKKTTPAKTTVKKMTLEQKLVELRKAVPYLKKDNEKDKIPYKWVKADDVWMHLNPVMNELGVNFRTGSETNVKFSNYDQKTKYGTRLMFLYEADMELIWVNAENPEDKIIKTVHAVAWQDDPAKAKGSAMTYAVKYDLFNQFSIPMGEMDPDNFMPQAEGQIIGSGKPQKAPAGKPEPEAPKTTGTTKGSTQGNLADKKATVVQRKDLEDKIDYYFNKEHSAVFTQLGIQSYAELTVGQYNKMMKLMAPTIKSVEEGGW